MTQPFQRYAIYWTPEPGSDLAAFAERWFGRRRHTFGVAPGLAARAVEKPARYGLHATLKAPFRLDDGASVEDLKHALGAFCAGRRAPAGGPLMLKALQRYLGLVLTGRTADIDWLAAECVTHFDVFRAPLNGTDLARRESAPMSPEEQRLLEAFGYPYVLSAFRFHVTLAGPLPIEELNEAANALRPHLAPFIGRPVRIESLSLLGEPIGGGDFVLLSRHRFR